MCQLYMTYSPRRGSSEEQAVAMEGWTSGPRRSCRVILWRMDPAAEHHERAWLERHLVSFVMQRGSAVALGVVGVDHERPATLPARRHRPPDRDVATVEQHHQ